MDGEHSGSTADAAEAYLRRRSRATLRARIAIVTHQLAQWRAWEADQLLAPAQRQGVERPPLAKEKLEDLWVALVEEQGHYGESP